MMQQCNSCLHCAFGFTGKLIQRRAEILVWHCAGGEAKTPAAGSKLTAPYSSVEGSTGIQKRMHPTPTEEDGE